jgi:hypothetical protein
MKFKVCKDLAPNKNNIILHKDMSYGSSKEDSSKWHFQVSLTKYSNILLNFNANNLNCVSCEGRLIENTKLQFVDIVIPRTEVGSLIYESTKIPQFGIEYSIKNSNIFYDRTNRILAIGDYNSEVDFFEFGIGQYVRLVDGCISAILIKFSD